MEPRGSNRNLSEAIRLLVAKNRGPAVRWRRVWVTEGWEATGGRCSLLKWVQEEKLQEQSKEAEEKSTTEIEEKPTTEVLILCSHEGCGRTFKDVHALRKHAQIHGKRHYVCPYEDCGKKFSDQSKLKRHDLNHSKKKDFMCPHEGREKECSVDYNLRGHMMTYCTENYYVCPFKDCKKRFTQEDKLNNHINSWHKKNATEKHSPPSNKLHYTLKKSSADSPAYRPYVCPYGGCGKAYIHEYKLKLHLRDKHPGHNTEENKKQLYSTGSAIDADNDLAACAANGSCNKSKRRKPGPGKTLPVKAVNQKALGFDSPLVTIIKKPVYSEEMDEDESEETEDDHKNIEEGTWRDHESSEEDEETEDDQ